jgi:pyrophosphatase PpaX
MKQNRFNSYVFDLDGTLVNTRSLIVEALQHAIQTQISSKPTVEQLDRFRSRSLFEVIQSYISEPEMQQQAVKSFHLYYDSHLDAVTPIPGIRNVLQVLSETGRLIGVVTTNHRQRTLHLLELIDVHKLVDSMICGDDVVHQKPNPESLERIITKHSLVRQECIFIGDSPSDILAGKRANVATGAVLWGIWSYQELLPMDPDYFFSKPAEILLI